MIKKSISILLIATSVLILGCEKEREKIPQYGMFEVSFQSENDSPFQFPKVSFVLPDGKTIEVDGFFDGDRNYKARAYCNKLGTWQWELKKQPGFKKSKGKFDVVESSLKGKLKKHPEDPYQFACDNGKWFLHIGDTGYRYLADTEPKWKEYIDQAKKMGATKVRT